MLSITCAKYEHFSYISLNATTLNSRFLDIIAILNLWRKRIHTCTMNSSHKHSTHTNSLLTLINNSFNLSVI